MFKRKQKEYWNTEGTYKVTLYLSSMTTSVTVTAVYGWYMNTLDSNLRKGKPFIIFAGQKGTLIFPDKVLCMDAEFTPNPSKSEEEQ